MFTAVVYVRTTGCAWRHLPPTFGTSFATAYRRFMIWTEAGPWRRLHRTNSGPGARWTGRRRSSTRRSEPGRSRQDRQQTARAVRCPGRPTQRRRVRREHAVQPRPRAAHPRHPRHPVPPRPRRRRPVKLRADKPYSSTEHLA
ncbi:transposase [Streptomyces niveus]|uniref:transposase n=1 Tax=Streptomyces niveus TaxID=193462 RepID=UPI003443DDC8